jgi:phosphonate transport system ATP-binding protein
VVGSSGAGKSTLLRAVNGLNRLSSGTVEIDGEPVPQAEGRELRQLRKRVGMIFQDFRLVKRLSVMSNVLIGRLAHVPGWRAMFNCGRPMTVRLHCRHWSGSVFPTRPGCKASDLSGGQQQRVGIARALAQEPAIILADEPVASLDPVTTHQIMRGPGANQPRAGHHHAGQSAFSRPGPPVR